MSTMNYKTWFRASLGSTGFPPKCHWWPSQASLCLCFCWLIFVSGVGAWLCRWCPHLFIQRPRSFLWRGPDVVLPMIKKPRHCTEKAGMLFCPIARLSLMWFRFCRVCSFLHFLFTIWFIVSTCFPRGNLICWSLLRPPPPRLSTWTQPWPFQKKKLGSGQLVLGPAQNAFCMQYDNTRFGFGIMGNQRDKMLNRKQPGK